MNILFSPLGLTDPIQNYHDGAMIHICRNYNIDKVYLFMSKEICEYHTRDNRYIYCLEKLEQKLAKRIEYEIIARPDMSEVQIFDPILNEFRKLINDIHNKNPEANLYLNISSGTPAMKSALQVLAVLRDFKTIPIQVATPERASNPRVEEKRNYNADEQWNCNEDNSKEESRCEISGNTNFLVEIKKQLIAELLAKYDYTGAYEIAKNMQDTLGVAAVELIKSAICRNNVEVFSAYIGFKKYGYDLLKIDEKDRLPVEYFLKVYIRVKKGEYSDFLRSITPLDAYIFERILKDRCGFDLDCYRIESTKKVYTKTNQKVNAVKEKEVLKGYRWDQEKLRKENQEAYKILEKKYEYAGSLRLDKIENDNLWALIEVLEKDADVVNTLKSIRNLETETRNIAAHEMQYVTDEWIKKQSGICSTDYIKLVKEAFKYTNINLPKGYMDSYDDMNKFILKELQQNS